ncbi:MAG: aminotransferase class I/II-fold pyridoxal phosphate-dependent enzyme, partial [Candidatus Dormibacteraeota bacterium]|nr:aminotransferase class I/II-fold pyridoxal phosphate-dependent enzyme [Candidatus Dormibacteraeota bacterium]
MSQLPKSADAALPARAAGPAETAHSGIREVVDVAISTPGCLRLEVGEPDFRTPAHIVEAAVEFLRTGRPRYTATAGLLSLRERIAALLARERGIVAGPDQICCGTGAVGAIAAALAAVV